MIQRDYKPPSILFNPHLETIYPALFRKVKVKSYYRERLTTPDHDFLDLDWLKQGSRKLVIISHGLEGNSNRGYVKGMARAFYQNGFDVLAWNYRGCSQELNHQLRFYHSGATDDLSFVVDLAIQKNYNAISLIGFSLGGNLTLKFLGENSGKLNSVITNAVAFSVPMALYTTCLQISRKSNWVYSQRFLNSLKQKIRSKAKSFPELELRGLSRIKTLIEFDDAYTAPLHGFVNAVDYYNQCSSIKFVSEITIPTLIVNAKNDPFLSEDCYPYHLLMHHPKVRFESPDRGGHVGFTLFNQNGLYWSEQRALTFVTESHA